MRHFAHIPPDRRSRLFHREPQEFHRDADPAELAVALGATLYSPGNRPRLAADIAKASAQGVRSMVVCLEDAIPDDDLATAERHVVEQLRSLHSERDRADRAGETGAGDLPLLFLRVRVAEQIPALVTALGPAAALLTGFVLPKFTAASGAAFLDALTAAVADTGHRLLAMPVIESREAAFRETRPELLYAVGGLLAKHRERVLAVRLGATDLCAAYGLRRPPDLTIYDIQPVAAVIADVVNVLGRADGTGFVVTGPVWEYFEAGERLFKPQLRQGPFDRQDHLPPGAQGPVGRRLRNRLLEAHLDGLIREVHLDKANGLTGKTVIHPSHVATVHALSVVTHEEYSDAADILGLTGGGAMASSYANKMNEAKPHRAWAERLMARAKVFGVAAEHVTFVDLIEAAAGR